MSGSGSGSRRRGPLSSVAAPPAGRLGRRRVPASPPALCSVPARSLPRSVRGPEGPAPAGAGGLWAAGRSSPQEGEAGRGPGAAAAGLPTLEAHRSAAFFAPEKKAKRNEPTPRLKSTRSSFFSRGWRTFSELECEAVCVSASSRGLFCCLLVLVSKTKPLRRLRAMYPALSPPCTRRALQKRGPVTV